MAAQPNGNSAPGPVPAGLIVIRVWEAGWALSLLDCDPHQAMRVMKAALDAVTQRHEQEHAASSADAPTEA